MEQREIDRRLVLSLQAFNEQARAHLAILGEHYARSTKIPHVTVTEKFDNPQSPKFRIFTASIEGSSPIFAAALAAGYAHLSDKTKDKTKVAAGYGFKDGSDTVVTEVAVLVPMSKPNLESQP